MTTDNHATPGPVEAQAVEAPKKLLTPAAKRALAEAEERRRLAAEEAARPKEINGRGGPDPVRYGDWEVKGIACDF